MEMLEGMHLVTLLLSLSLSNKDLQQIVKRSCKKNETNGTNYLSNPDTNNITHIIPLIGLKYFISKIGRVEIRNHQQNDDDDTSSSLLPVFFPIPEMCLKFNREYTKQLFNESLPRSVENLRRFQQSAYDLYAAMCVERQLNKFGLGKVVSGAVWSKARDVLAVFGILGNVLNLLFLEHLDDSIESNVTDVSAAVSETAATGTTLQYPFIQSLQKLVIVIQFIVCGFVVLTRMLLTRSITMIDDEKTNILSSSHDNSKKRCCCLSNSCCCVKCCINDCCCNNKVCLSLCCAGVSGCGDGILIYYLIYMLSMFICLFNFDLGYIIQWIALLDVMIRNETARSVLKSVTSPAKQLAITLFLSMVFSYFFALIGFFFFQHDYEMHECNTLRTCFLTTLNQGVRAGGGIGEYMRPIDPFSGDHSSDSYSYWLFRTGFDLLFFLMLNIVLLNLVFGIIIDNFAERRFERQEKNINKSQFCFACDVSRRKFDQLG
jgi:hypothetical protein